MSDELTPESAPDSPTDSPAPSRASRQGLVIGLVVGLILGGGGVALAWYLTGDDPSAGAETDAAAACLAIDDADIPESDDDLDMATAQRWGGAAALAMGAAEGDDRFQPLADELEKASSTIRSFQLDQAGAFILKAQGICDDL